MLMTPSHGKPELRVGAETGYITISEIAIGDGQQRSNLVAGGLVRRQPTEFLPLAQAHAGLL